MSTPAIALLCAAIIFFVLLLLMAVFRFNPIARLVLLLRGCRTTARIISAQGLNRNPESAINTYDLSLQLGPPFNGQQVQGRVVGPRHALLLGQSVAVVVDPQNPSNFRIDWKSANELVDRLARGDLSAFGIPPHAPHAPNPPPQGSAGMYQAGATTQNAYADQSPIDRVAQLERLQRLRQQGAITDAEFSALKQQLMG
jgi:hypothetical protein